jgi:hypothetical protein
MYDKVKAFIVDILYIVHTYSVESLFPLEEMQIFYQSMPLHPSNCP